MNCKICRNNVVFAFQAKVLRKYDVGYFHCLNCGLLQTEEPYWLEEAYGNAVADADTGLVQRNLHLSKMLSALLFFVFDQEGKYLDVAGGYGMLTRLMRDVGFNFYWSDKYCENILARGFEAVADSSFTAVTAFEVLEHVPDPLGFVTESMAQAKSRTMIFSTELFEGTPPKPESWWYYAFDGGQHISFYQKKTLKVVADKLGLNFYTNNNFHMITKEKFNPVLYKLLTGGLVRILSVYVKRNMRTKTFSDHESILKSW